MIYWVAIVDHRLAMTRSSSITSSPAPSIERLY
jgi:hypothetical protein